MFCKLGNKGRFVNLSIVDSIVSYGNEILALKDGEKIILGYGNDSNDASEKLNHMMLAFENGQTVYQLN